MHTNTEMTCRGRECTISKVLPFAGPLAALLGMFAVMAAVAVPMMIG